MKIPPFKQLTTEQKEAYTIPAEGMHLISGPPGTGKTIVGIYRAQRMNKMNHHTQFITHSRLLTAYNIGGIDELGIDGIATTYHSWTWRFYRRNYHHKPPQIQDYVFDWNAILMKVLKQKPSEVTIPHVILDEAQDLPKEFFQVIKYMSKSLTVFADENQRITEINCTLDDIKSCAQIDDSNHNILEINFRNTREIAEVSKSFYTGLPSGIPDIPKRSGPKPRILKIPNFNDNIEKIRYYENNYQEYSVGVLLKTLNRMDKYYRSLNGRTKNEVEIYKNTDESVMVDFDKPGIKLLSYASAKGLEFDLLFLPELENFCHSIDDEARMLMYTLTSRAREELMMMYSSQNMPEILKDIPKEKIIVEN
tara:strand:- start:47 stop:1141 length:1095 start_codon:yes stop_codon:yes gene_type:complete